MNGASQGEEAVSADSGLVGEIPVWVGEKAAFLSILLSSRFSACNNNVSSPDSRYFCRDRDSPATLELTILIGMIDLRWHTEKNLSPS
jgi:hypothetical protein